MNEKRETRKTGTHLRVPVLAEEKSIISQNAASAGLSIAGYLRNLSLGYSVKSRIDEQHIMELVKINADLGRLGGLLKMWLANDRRAAHFKPDMIKVLLQKIETTQDSLFKKVKTL